MPGSAVYCRKIIYIVFISTWWQKALIAFDLETTGLDLENDRIITAAVSVVGQDIDPQERSWEINPGIPISAEAQELHGISSEQAASFTPTEQALPQLLDYLQQQLEAHPGAPLVVFNAPFDLTILDRQARRCGLRPLQERLELLVVDPLVLDRAVDPWRPGSRRLPEMAKSYGLLAPETEHDAGDDALVSARLAWKIGQRYSDYLNVSLPALHQQQIIWAQAQARGLAEHFRRQGEPSEVSEHWPLAPAAENTAPAAVVAGPSEG
jgi:DNA polymerase-3 subunit epsilon